MQRRQTAPSPLLGRITNRRISRDRAYRRACADIAALCIQAHDSGESWPRVAEALGMTRQGLAKFLREHG